MSSVNLEVRLKSSVKNMAQRAAVIRNQTLGQFLETAIAEQADKVVAEHNRTVLSNRDRDMFLRLLDSPPKPNKAFRAAAERYKKLVKSDVGR